jgi:hypothetical protein
MRSQAMPYVWTDLDPAGRGFGNCHGIVKPRRLPKKMRPLSRCAIFGETAAEKTSDFRCEDSPDKPRGIRPGILRKFLPRFPASNSALACSSRDALLSSADEGG